MLPSGNVSDQRAASAALSERSTSLATVSISLAPSISALAGETQDEVRGKAMIRRR